MRAVVRPGIVLVVFWFNAAVAQEGYLGQDHDKWHHSFYQTLERPDTKSPCCNLTDCRPTSGRQVDGHYEVKVNGSWVSVLQNLEAVGTGPWISRLCSFQIRRAA